MLCFCQFNRVIDDDGGVNLDARSFEPSGSVLQLHAMKQGMNLIAFNIRTVYDVKVTTLSYSPNVNPARLSFSFSIKNDDIWKFFIFG